MSAESFLKRLENENLIDAGVIAKLRQQIGRANSPVPAQQVAGLLVDKGHLTKFQAKKLLEGHDSDTDGSDRDLDLAGEAKPGKSDPSASAKKKAAAAPPPAPEKSRKKTAPPPAPKKKQKSAPPPAAEKNVDDQDALQPLSADDGLQPLAADDGLQPLGTDDALAPMDDLSGSDLMMGTMPGEGQADMFAQSAPQQQPSKSTKPQFRGKKFRQNQWDSPWLLIGGGLLILLMLISGGLVFVLTKGDAGKLYEAADKAYRQESYSDAIDKFDTFLQEFPEDDNVPKARVYRALARLWLPLSSGDWTRALEVANDQLPEVQSDIANVPEARVQLSSQLTMIAQGIVADAVEAARTDTDAAKELIELVDSENNKQDAMDLVGNPTYVPSTEREKPVIKDRIDQVHEDVLRVRREINKEEELVATVSRMTEAADKKKTSEAFEMRILLMQKYGEGVGHDERIAKAVKYVSDKERGLVQPKKKELVPTKTATSKDVAARIVLASRVGQDLSKLEGQVAVYLMRGSVYALDAGSGKVLWRRFVGEETTVQPQRMSAEVDADVILVDGRDNSLLRVDASTGEPKWRLVIGRMFASPIITEDRILVADQSGRVIDIDPETGKSERHVQFPQSLYAGPAMNNSGTYFYQAGEHSNIYVVGADDMQCRDVLYLGHKAGSVPTAPVMSQGYLFVAVNSGADYSILHILEATNRGLNLRPAQKVRLEGHVVVPLQLYGRRVIAVTNLGAVSVFEVDGTDEDEPILEIASYAKRWSQPVVGYPLASSGFLWVADRAFSIFQLQTAKGEVSQLKVLNDRDSFLAPPQLFGDVVVHVRRRRGEVGATVTAVNGKSGDTQWRTDLAVPLAGGLVFDPSKDSLSLVTAQASLFEVGMPKKEGEEPAETTQVVDSNAIFQAGTSELGLNVRYGLTFPDGKRTYSGPAGSDRLLRYDPNDPDRRILRFRKMEIPPNSLAAEPVLFDDGMLVPANDGLIYHIDPATGKERKKPFQPAIEPGKKLGWQRPTVLDPGKQFIAIDAKNRLHLVAASAGSTPHLESNKHVELPPLALGPPAVAGSRCFVATRSSKSDALISYQLPNLDGYMETVKDARVTWGPHSIGDAVVFSTDDNKMHCVTADHTQRWTIQFNHGFPVSRPLTAEGSFFVATREGSVVKLNAADGKQSESASVDEPLEKGPYLVDGRILAVGPDGTIHVLRTIQ